MVAEASAPADSLGVAGEDGNQGRPGSALPNGVLEAVQATLGSARDTISRLFDLMSLEARRASLAVMWMVVLGGVAVICTAAAWVGVMVVLSLCAISLGAQPLVVASMVAVLNVIAAVVLVYACASISRELLFPATRRQIAGQFPIKPDSP